MTNWVMSCMLSDSNRRVLMARRNRTCAGSAISKGWTQHQCAQYARQGHWLCENRPLCCVMTGVQQSVTDQLLFTVFDLRKPKGPPHDRKLRRTFSCVG